MLSKPYFRSFAGGEITGEMYARVDLNSFQTGMAVAENFRVLPHGPVESRAGFQYITHSMADAGAPARLIPFQFNAEQTVVLEFGASGAIRFFSNGGAVLENPKAIVAVTVGAVTVVQVTAHGYSTWDSVYLGQVDGVPELNGRFVNIVVLSPDTFQVFALDGLTIDTTGSGPYTGSGTSSRVYQIASPYIGGDVMSIHYTQSADVLTLVHPSYPVKELRRLGATNWQLVDVTFAPTITAPAAPALAVGGPGGGTPIALEYVCTAIANETLEESVASPSATVNRDLTVVGNYVDIDPPNVVGAVRYYIYKKKAGLFGYIGSTDGGAFRDDNIDPDVTTTPPVSYNPFVGTDNYPSTVTYFEQRRCFAATNNQPQHHWFTRSATESNMSQSVPVRDDDAIIFRIAAAQQNRVRHLVPLTDLLSLTVGAEWRITPSSGDFLTPAVVPRPQSYVGANDVQPVVTSSACMYVQSRGGHIRELSYGGESNNYGYRSLDASILAPHLVDNYSITDLAFSRATVPTLWAVRSDGVLLGLTYVPEQNVRAWHHHTTAGRFESICCVAEGGEDVLYAVVARGLNYHIERLHSRYFETIADCFFVDAGVSYDGFPITVLYGLWHLEGKEVTILADGAVQPNQTVVNGSITLMTPASKVHAGMAYLPKMVTLPVTLEASAGLGQGAMKNISKVHIRVSNSSGTFVGPKDGVLREAKQRTTEPYGTPPSLVTGTQSVNVQPSWNLDGQIQIEQRAPLPLTILSMALETAS